MKKVSLPSGTLELEGVIHFPQGVGPFPGVVVCHPHPLYGGDMYNNVVMALCKALAEASMIALRFNFRGVGRSQGRYGQGMGEQEDVAAAVSFVSSLEEVDASRLGVVGYSFGAAVALTAVAKEERVKAMAAVSLPFGMLDLEFLKSETRPKLLISGSSDSFILSSEFLSFCEGLCEPREFELIPGVDHFWWGYEDKAAQKVATFFSQTLGRQA